MRDAALQAGTLTISVHGEDGADGAGTVMVTLPGEPCSSTCTYSYEEGASVTLTANPSSGSFFYRWKDHQDQVTIPCAPSSFETPCILHLTGTATDIDAVFLPDPTLAVGVTGNEATVTVSPGGVCNTSQGGSEACYFPVERGSTVTLTPDAVDGSTFVGWSVPECPGTGECKVVIDSQFRSVVATYSPMHLSVLVESGNVNGAVTGGPINCAPTSPDPSTCNADLPAFDEVTLKASSPGFLGWNGACLEAGKSQTCTIRLSGDDVVGAQFEGAPPPVIIPPRIPVKLEVKKTGDGQGTVSSARSRLSETINCGSGPGCNAYFQQGETAKLVADPAAGSMFVGWKTPGDLCSGSLSCKFEIMRVSRLEATFAKRAQPPPPPPPSGPPPPRSCAVRKFGTPRADRLDGGTGGDAIYGRAGNDRIRGFGGTDCLFGEGGKDEVRGGPGNDTVGGGKGSDLLYGGTGRDNIKGGPGRDRIFAVDGARDVIACGPGRDTVRADPRDQVLGCEVRRP
jgi:RTX calcium-binding nonapeptide repeat (4 copies)/Divergent InlB B-repeat domain